VTDPPYSLNFMNKDWDKNSVAFDPDTWIALATALKPGGYLLAFGGTRTWHRLACAIEDAGLIIQDTIMWVYGQGMNHSKSSLKPAWEPIIMAYNPGGKKELQINECRIGTGGDKGVWPITNRLSERQTMSGSLNCSLTDNAVGRWPANLIHDGSDEVLDCFPQSKDGIAGKRSGVRGITTSGLGGYDKVWGGYGGEGSAARFYYCAKASRSERAGSKHPTIKPIALMKYLIQLVTPPGGTVLDPFAGSGSTGIAAALVGRNPILIERDEENYRDMKLRIANYAKENM
jgi:site-specific DNA-methyltransferase (adenine-specific)